MQVFTCCVTASEADVVTALYSRGAKPYGVILHSCKRPGKGAKQHITLRKPRVPPARIPEITTRRPRFQWDCAMQTNERSSFWQWQYVSPVCPLRRCFLCCFCVGLLALFGLFCSLFPGGRHRTWTTWTAYRSMLSFDSQRGKYASCWLAQTVQQPGEPRRRRTENKNSPAVCPRHKSAAIPTGPRGHLCWRWTSCR